MLSTLHIYFVQWHVLNLVGPNARVVTGAQYLHISDTV
jgi:hypothetical protein